MNSTEIKFNMLKENILKYKRVLIAYSGGADSNFLLKVAYDVLGKNNVLAVMLTGEMMLEKEIEAAKLNAKSIGANLMCEDIDIYSVGEFLENGPERCYYCKKFIFKRIVEIANKHGYNIVCDGSNADDELDYRPGRRALRELNVKSPIADAGLTKAEVRNISKKMEISTYNLPARACLATRVPYNTKITPDLIKRVALAEEYLLENGFLDVRVRTHGKIAIIEVPKEDLERLFEKADEIIKEFKKMGYLYITGDLAGRRTGSINEMLK